MNDEIPKVTRTYQNHHLDSTRWEVFEPRDDDIVVTTSYKSGTTWAGQILHHLLHGHEDPIPVGFAQWPDARFFGTRREDLAKAFADDPGPRELKSHLPLDGLPYYSQVKYIIVARDARDVFMSFFNHYSNYTELAYSMLNAPDHVGDDLPPCPEDPRTVWQSWMTRGWFEWESEGWPFWSNLHHTQSYWDYKHLPNFLFLHYNDMLADLEGAARKIAAFAEIDVSDAVVERTVEATTFSAMKKVAVEQSEQSDSQTEFWKGGQKTFIHKGTNGRWRDVLTEEDLALYDEARTRVLTPDCAEWLEHGGSVD